MSAVDQILTDTRRALDGMREPRPADAAAEQVTGEGEAAEGKVRVVATLPGHVQSMTMDPRMMRLGSEAVCEALTEAVNAALADLRAKTTTGANAPVDLERLSGDLEAIQTESLQSMRTMFGALEDVMGRIDRRT
ncbi:YbaB/EbfC family nucleoid-associated protein [Tenggerimyces flavus]|uniref:YbaB/EbfC family nucleoid-associated protein n=1 Tax=Tenggerimyces flavus TaxID=1708749 RepID=A0ABV7Y9Z1_9ACTN|nr:YbaB/EbfC family nucleoid-associated protein [Tenggerimyces flavus]MBM7783625.1 DNA-binding protein YbaB [Tenggerimyces flavus]